MLRYNADSLTSKAAVVERRAVDLADSLNPGRDTCGNEVARSEITSVSVTRFPELGVMRGVARNKSYVGSR